MAFPQSNPIHRARRIRLGASIPALVMKEDGQRDKAQLQTLSTTGGLLHLSRALEQGDFVEVAFQTQSGKVQGLAEMLDATQKAKNGITQAFRFVALGDDDHRTLRMAVDLAEDRAMLDFSSRFPRKNS